MVAFTIAASLSSSSSSMEVKKVSALEHDNKENIPPFSSASKPGPDAPKPKCSSVKINEGRRPLRDITNVYGAAASQSGQVEFWDFNVTSSVLVSGFSSNRKRKSVDDCSVKRHCSKILRRDFR